MAFRPTLTVLSKASRLPLSSKQARKDFYKGPGAMPGLGPRAQGRHSRSKAPYIKMVEKMRYFVAPKDWLHKEHGGLNTFYSSNLKPYVFKGKNISATRDWPQAVIGKPEDHYSSKRQGIYGPDGFDGAYYLQLAELNRGRTPA